MSVSSRCSCGRVVDRQRRGGSALGPVGGGLGQRAGGDERDAGALAGGGQRGEEPGRAGADDDEVGSHTSTRYYGVAMEETSRRALWLRHDDIFAHDVPGHPERPARIRALEAEMSAHGWFGASRVEAPEVSRDVLELVHPASYVDSIA